MLIDAHCHLNQISRDMCGHVLRECRDHRLVDCGIDYDSCEQSLSLSRDNFFVYSALGFHPSSADQFSSKTLGLYKKLLETKEKVVAIGEIGLDEKIEVPLPRQEEIFSAFIQLAKDQGLPILIHNRTASHRILDILDEHFSDYQQVIFHCFSYGLDLLTRIVQKQGSVSFSLNVLRGNTDIIAALKKCPLGQMFLETDSPYMKIKGLMSIPLDISKIYSYVAHVKDLHPKDLEATIADNAQRLLGIK